MSDFSRENTCIKLLSSTMENILNNPGLQHIAENIFLNLNYETLEVCQQINKNSKQILENPMFWLKKFIRRGLSKKNQMDWIEVIRITRETELEPYILSYLKRCSKNEKVVDLPCYINKDVIEKCSTYIQQFLADFLKDPKEVQQDMMKDQMFQLSNGNKIEDIQMYALIAVYLKLNPNAPQEYGITPIHIAADEGFVDFVQILAPLTENPNAPDEEGETPIHRATEWGRLNIVKILAPLTENPNAPDNNGDTPIHIASDHGYLEIVQLLASKTDEPNAPNDIGVTPIHLAVDNGNLDILRILAPLTDKPNAPNDTGITPIHIAASGSHSVDVSTEMIKVLAPLTKNLNYSDKYGITPIQIAVRFDKLEIIRILAPLIHKATGLDVNTPNIFGLTPIHLAARNGNLEIVKILTPLADDPYARNQIGESPIDVAAKFEKSEIVDFLNSYQPTKDQLMHMCNLYV